MSSVTEASGGPPGAGGTGGGPTTGMRSLPTPPPSIPSTSCSGMAATTATPSTIAKEMEAAVPQIPSAPSSSSGMLKAQWQMISYFFQLTTCIVIKCKIHFKLLRPEHTWYTSPVAAMASIGSYPATPSSSDSTAPVNLSPTHDPTDSSQLQV